MEKNTFDEIKSMDRQRAKNEALEISPTGYGLVSHMSDESKTIEGHKTDEL